MSLQNKAMAFIPWKVKLEAATLPAFKHFLFWGYYFGQSAHTAAQTIF